MEEEKEEEEGEEKGKENEAHYHGSIERKKAKPSGPRDVMAMNDPGNEDIYISCSFELPLHLHLLLLATASPFPGQLVKS